MSPQPRGIRFRGPQQQRGAIGLMAAVTLGMVLLFMLLVVDSGRLYFEQRKLQRVADVAVLEAVSRGGSCLTTPKTAQTYADESATRNGFTPGGTQTLGVTCGTLETINSLRTFVADGTKSDAIRVIATTVVPTSVAGGLWDLFSNGTFKFDTHLTASAVGAGGGAPLAMLTIRTSLATIDSTKSPLLNAVIGGLLGGKLDLTAVSWKGLADTNINLLSYLDQLAIDLDLSAGSYNELLDTDVSATQLLNAAVKVLAKGGPGADVALNAVKAISLIASNTQILKLGDLLKIQNGTPSAGLNTDLKVLELLQGIVQLSNGENAIAANVTSDIPLVGTVTLKLKVIEPAQMSVIGNPALAIKDPLGPDGIFVKTAQVQTQIHIDLTVLKLVSQILSFVTQTLSFLTDAINNILQLKLFGHDKTSLSIASSLDVFLEAASANSYVTAYNCANSTVKSLTVQTSSAAAKLSIGTQPTAGVFPPTVVVKEENLLAVDPVKLISIDVTHCASILGIGLSCDPIQIGKGGGLGLKVQTEIASTSEPYKFTPPNLAEANTTATFFHLINGNANIVGSLGDSLNNKLLVTYTPQTGNITNSALDAVAVLVNGITGVLSTALKGLLSDLLDPIIKTVLGSLGVGLANAEVSANLSCGQGGRAQLVL